MHSPYCWISVNSFQLPQDRPINRNLYPHKKAALRQFCKIKATSDMHTLLYAIVSHHFLAAYTPKAI